MKDFSANIVVITKTVIKVHFRYRTRPTNLEMLQILNDNEYADISDERVLSYQSIESLEFIRPVYSDKAQENEDDLQ